MTPRDHNRRSGHLMRHCVCVNPLCGRVFLCQRRGRPRVTCSVECARLHYNARQLANYYARKETAPADEETGC